ncbi:hypothetical protein EUX98_g6077 [Antrodiella citrinella]|uniref:Uncharacterized protein n=1 Tax=Antrodiella citrinella TaxID=2447956 RepID=A0A4S4MPX8_9APHY|nr:hypothetical protein EUX98_g6077 [Antrodiella citrinella]
MRERSHNNQFLTSSFVLVVVHVVPDLSFLVVALGLAIQCTFPVLLYRRTHS